MDSAARRRWTILLSALVITIAAIFYPVDNDQSEDAVVGVAGVARISRTAALVTSSSPNLLAGQSVSDADPFAPRGWQAPPPPEPKIVPVVAAAPVVPLAPVGPPPLPFKFMGRMNDDGKQVLYLSLGDKILVARNGDTVEGSYKVLGIDAQQIEFEYLPTGEKQTLAFPATDN